MNGTVSKPLLDTDIFIDHLRGKRRLPVGRDGASYSVVTRCELFAGSEDEEGPVRELLAPLQELPVGREVAELAGQLRRDIGIHVPDALIAATALRLGLTVVTRNLRHFESVPHLRVSPG